MLLLLHCCCCKCLLGVLEVERNGLSQAPANVYWSARPLWEVITQKVPPSLPNDVKKWLLKKPSKDMKKNQSKTDVKSRLSDKVIPVEERLGEKVEFKTPTMPRKKSSTKDKGKRKVDTLEKKAWVEKKQGILAKGETIYSKIECRSSKGCLLAKVMDEDEDTDKNWKRAKKEKKD